MEIGFLRADEKFAEQLGMERSILHGFSGNGVSGTLLSACWGTVSGLRSCSTARAAGISPLVRSYSFVVSISSIRLSDRFHHQRTEPSVMLSQHRTKRSPREKFHPVASPRHPPSAENSAPVLSLHGGELARSRVSQLVAVSRVLTVSVIKPDEEATLWVDGPSKRYCGERTRPQTTGA